MAERIRVIIMGAAGRDFHNFNVYFRDNNKYEVKALTATQIPGIEERRYPHSLSGPLYPDGIPIFPEEKIGSLIKKNEVDQVVFAYSDVSHEYVMQKASQVLASGADFRLMGLKNTMLTATIPVVSVCAVRTGSGKSQTSRNTAKILKNLGFKVAVVRHPMPYGNLEKQVCQRFASYEDLDKHNCTIEEREEYEPHIDNGIVVYAGVDYEKILRTAEKEAEIIVWDGGNNDIPFFKSNLHIVVVDPHRPGHELSYYPGETNLRIADVVIVNKIDTANQENIQKVKRNVRKVNSKTTILEAASPVSVDKPELIKNRKVLVVEDGPTLTHGGMSYGAGTIAAKKHGASQIVDPRPYAVGSIAEAYKKYTQLDALLPALGYGEDQIRELEQTINATPCDTIVIGTPVDLRRIIKLSKPTVRVRYELQEAGQITLKQIFERYFKK